MKVNPLNFQKTFLDNLTLENFDKEVTKNFPLYAPDYWPLMEKTLSNLLRIAFQKIKTELLVEITNKILEEYKNKTEPLTKEEIIRIVNSMSKEMTRYIFRMPNSVPTDLEI